MMRATTTKTTKGTDRLGRVLRDIINEHGSNPVTVAEVLNRRRITTERYGPHWHALHVVRVCQRRGIKVGELMLAVRPE
jgi:hypothetical protein